MDKNDFNIFDLENMRSFERYKPRNITRSPISQKDIDKVNRIREIKNKHKELKNKGGN